MRRSRTWPLSSDGDLRGLGQDRGGHRPLSCAEFPADGVDDLVATPDSELTQPGDQVMAGPGALLGPQRVGLADGPLHECGSLLSEDSHRRSTRRAPHFHAAVQAFRRPTPVRAGSQIPAWTSISAASASARRGGGRDQYVLGAILMRCAVKARQIGTTPNRSRWMSMNAQLSGAAVVLPR